MKSKHTPGPWHPRNHRNDAGGEVRDDEGLWVARVHQRDGGADGAACVANTNLIAAAPDLLAALKEMLDKGEGCAACGFGAPGCGCRYERARAAIAKAEGKS